MPLDSPTPSAVLRRLPSAQRVITALDVPDAAAAVALAARLGDHGRYVKVGMELFTAEGPDVIARLREAGREIFLDLKYKDIPNTVSGAVASACRLGVGMLTLHADGGRRMLEAAVEAADRGSGGGLPRPALLAVTVLTSLAPEEAEEVAPGGGPIAERIVRLARLARDTGCDGVVCSPKDLTALRRDVGPDILAVTPGVRPAGAAGDDQRRVATPAAAMADGADFLVVGRPITRADDPADAIAAITRELDPS